MRNRTGMIGALVLALGVGAACTGSKDEDGARRAADNTGVNERDRAAGAPTAQSAGMGKSDVDIMAAIRKRVVADDSLSTNAHNVKIVAADGTVHLKGPVASGAERATIVRIATDEVGAKNVVDELEIAP